MKYHLTPQGAEQIQLVMSELGLTPQELGDKINKAQGTLSAWFAAKQGTSLENYQKLYEALGCDPRLTFLEYGSDKQYISSQREWNNPIYLLRHYRCIFKQ